MIAAQSRTAVFPTPLIPMSTLTCFGKSSSRSGIPLKSLIRRDRSFIFNHNPRKAIEHTNVRQAERGPAASSMKDVVIQGKRGRRACTVRAVRMCARGSNSGRAAATAPIASIQVVTESASWSATRWNPDGRRGVRNDRAPFAKRAGSSADSCSKVGPPRVLSSGPPVSGRARVGRPST